jgi:acetyl-CoA carboxylase beta subunit
LGERQLRLPVSLWGTRGHEQLVLVLMDNAAHAEFTRCAGNLTVRVQTLEQALQTACPLVVFDVSSARRKQEGDTALAEAMRRHGLWSWRLR